MRKVWIVTFDDDWSIVLSKSEDILDNILAYCYAIIAGDEYGKPTSDEIAKIRDTIKFYEKQNFSSMGIGKSMFTPLVSVQCVELR